MCKRFLNYIEKSGRELMVIGACIFYSFLLLMCVSQLFQSNNVATRSLQPIPHLQEIQIPIRIVDSLNSADASALIAKLDSTIQVVHTWNDYCDNRILHGLDDLRQETNNVINKQNAWLSFWIAILALVGALFPFIIQLKVQHDQKKEFDNRVDEFNKQLVSLDKSKTYSEITKLSFTLISCLENEWAKDDISRYKFWNKVLEDINNKVEIFFDSIENGQVSSDKIIVQSVLVQLHAVYTNCKFILSNKYKVRKLSYLISTIDKILTSLNDDKRCSEDDIAQLLNQMSEFRL